MILEITDLFNRIHLKLKLAAIMVMVAGISVAQEPPPIPITVTPTAQGLSFGAFYHGAAGGTVTISPTGTRSATGDVVLLTMGYSFSAALYEIVANQGSLISILNGPDVSLPGSNGGTLTLQIGSSDPLSPFVTTVIPPLTTLLYIGGTLTIGSSFMNPPGDYSGTFDLILIQE